MKTMFLRRDTLTCFFFLGLTMSLFAQGSLTPPGTPAPTMKTLDQIQPRTPISSLPYTISTAGSYYLTGNLTATGSGAGITVSANNVTIDLNGFALIGGGSGSVPGITVPAAQQSLCVRNGTVSGWTNSGIAAGNATVSLYEKLRLLNNNPNTINAAIGALQTGSGSTIKDCNFTNSGNVIANMILGGSANTVVNCSVVTTGSIHGINVGPGSTVIGSSVTGNSPSIGVGIIVSDNCSVTQCAVYAYHIGIDVSGNFGTIAHCTVAACTGQGIISEGSGTMVSDCVSDNNNSNGISLTGAGTVSHCTVTGNLGTQVSVSDGSAVTNCTITNGGGTGISLGNGSTVRGCTIRGSSKSGITGTSGNYIEGNTCDANNTSVNSSAAGIYVTGQANRIDNNNITSNGYAGLQVTAGGNIIIRNTFSGAEYIVVSGNTVGPLVDMASGGTITSTSPWANFHYN